MDGITHRLFEMQDVSYKNFQCKFIPTVDADTVIGVRIPVLRKFAKEFAKTKACGEFIQHLPHQYYDENNLHAFVIEGIKDYNEAIKAIENFLPYIDNWATCDMLSPRSFKNNLVPLYERIKVWIRSGKTYTVRFAINMLMNFYLDEATFDKEHLQLVASADSDDYYVYMAVAWYYATAMVKHYDEVLPLLLNHRLLRKTHNQTIQKAIESYRITAEQKDYLRGLKVKRC